MDLDDILNLQPITKEEQARSASVVVICPRIMAPEGKLAVVSYLDPVEHPGKHGNSLIRLRRGLFCNFEFFGARSPEEAVMGLLLRNPNLRLILLDETVYSGKYLPTWIVNRDGEREFPDAKVLWEMEDISQEECRK